MRELGSRGRTNMKRWKMTSTFGFCRDHYRHSGSGVVLQACLQEGPWAIQLLTGDPNQKWKVTSACFGGGYFAQPPPCVSSIFVSNRL